jgi:predicted ABC-type ATPase
MDEAAAKKWVKDKKNRAAVLDQFFEDFPHTKARIAFFMAGIPGAGKTEFAEQAIRENSPALIPIEHDKLVEYIDGYTPENYYNYRKAGSTFVTDVFNDCLKKGYGFIFDGTLSHENGIRNVRKALKAGYATYVVYIVQDAQVAWELTQARELVKKRAIERRGFLETCDKINKNLQSIFRAFKDQPEFNFWVINKGGALSHANATAVIHSPSLDKTDEIEKALKTGYNLDLEG